MRFFHSLALLDSLKSNLEALEKDAVHCFEEAETKEKARLVIEQLREALMHLRENLNQQSKIKGEEVGEGLRYLFNIDSFKTLSNESFAPIDESKKTISSSESELSALKNLIIHNETQITNAERALDVLARPEAALEQSGEIEEDTSPEEMIKIIKEIKDLESEKSVLNEIRGEYEPLAHTLEQLQTFYPDIKVELPKEMSYS